MNARARGARGIRDEIAPSRTVLLLVDFINPLDFDGAEQLRESALDAARASAALKRDLAAKGAQTIYANDNYGVWHTDFSSLWQRCSKLPGEAGRMARLLKPARRDFTILKPRHSAFYLTPLELLLTQLRCRRLVLAGLAADNCLLFTAMDAYLRGYAVWAPANCTAAESSAAKQRSLALMQRTVKARIEAWRPNSSDR